MKKWQKFIIWFVYLCLVSVPFDLIKYFLDNNLLNKWYFFGAGFALFFLGWLGFLLEIKLGTKRKRK